MCNQAEFRNLVLPIESHRMTSSKTVHNDPLLEGIQKSSHRLNAYLSNCFLFFFAYVLFYAKLAIDNLMFFDYL